MPAPLVLRILTDITQTLRATSVASSSFTSTGKAALGMGVDIEKATKTAVINGVRMEDQLTAEAAAYRKLAESATLSSREQAKAAQYAGLSQAKLAREQGLLVASSRGVSTGSKTAEHDLGKLTRGALAGSGVISALGRSLAFASTGFIVVAGTATILHNAITEALGFAAAEKQVTAQLKTSGLSYDASKSSIDAYLNSESKLSGFTRQDLLQSFGSLVRVSGNVGQSLKLDSVAADVARGRHIALASASIALAKALGGSSTALRRLGIIVPKTATGMDAINFVAAKFAGQAEAGATSADHLHASLVNASEVIGTQLLPTFNRLASGFSDWVSKLQASGELQKDANFLFSRLGDIFHTLEAAIRRVDDATGGFTHTIGLLIALELGSKMLALSKTLGIIAADWTLVGTAATRAGVAQEAALTTGGAAGVAGGATAARAEGLLGPSLAASLPLAIRKRLATRAAAGAIGGEAEVGAVATPLAGIIALGIAATLAAGSIDDFSKSLVNKLPGAGGGESAGGKILKKAIDDYFGFVTSGFVGNKSFGLIYEATHKFAPITNALGLTSPPGPQPTRQGVLMNALGISQEQILGPPPSQRNFGGAAPMTQFWKTFTLTFKEQMAAAQAALTQGNADDVAAAKQVVARIKKEIDEGNIKGPALWAALQLEASAYSTIWSAEAAAAQKRAAAAAAAKQKIVTEIQNAIDPLKLEVALARAQSLGRTGVPQLKDLLVAAYKGLAKAIANGNQQLVLQAYQQIKNLKDQIKAAATTAASTFTVPAKLALDIARDQALGRGITDDLKEEKKALLKWISSHRKNIQGVTDAYNQIAAINSQINSQTTSAYGDYKKASVKALTANLGLSADARRRFEQRLSQIGPGGTVPETGTGAAGYIIDPNTGRPVRAGHHSRHRAASGGGGYSGPGGGVPHIGIDLNVYIDGKQVEASVTRNQQRRRRHNPTQTRGPNAATSVA